MTPPETAPMADPAPNNGARTPRMDGRMRAAIRWVGIVGVVLTVVAAAVFSVRSAVSVGIGAAVAVLNLWILARAMIAILPGDGETPSPGANRGWAFIALLKMLGLFFGVWLLMSRHIVDPLPMLVGFGALPIGIAIGSIVSDRTAAP